MNTLVRLRDAVAATFGVNRPRAKSSPESQPPSQSRAQSEGHDLGSVTLDRRLEQTYTVASATSNMATKTARRKVVEVAKRKIDRNYVEEGEADTDEEAPKSGRRRNGQSATKRQKLEQNVDLDTEHVSHNARSGQYLDRHTELARRQETEDHLAGLQWHPDEEFLYRVIANRGLEPLLPAQWELDFGNCPPALFTPDIHSTVINAQIGTDFAATTALSGLTTLGSRVRPLFELGVRAEPVVARELERYIKWSAKDGGFHGYRGLPILRVFTAEPGMRNQDVSTMVQEELRHLAQLHRQDCSQGLPDDAANGSGEASTEYVRAPPVLYGLICIRYHVIVVTLDSADLEGKLHLVAPFNFNEPDMDVWNGFGVAIAICVVRNKMMERIYAMRESKDKN